MTSQSDSRGPDAPLTEEALGDLRRNLARLSTPGLENPTRRRGSGASWESRASRRARSAFAQEFPLNEGVPVSLVVRGRNRTPPPG
jgi:hypothetical protein